MVTHQTVDAETLAKRLAKVFEDHPDVREIWMSDHRGITRFWIITNSLDHDAELGIFRESAVLYDEFPGARHEVFTISPDTYPPGFDLRQSVPSRAQQVAFRHDE